MASLKEERCWFFALFIGIILQIICLSLEWTHAEYPLRFSKSQYLEKLDLQSGYPFFGSEFRGGIFDCISGCSSTFQLELDDWCDISDHLKEVCPGCIEDNYAQSLCKLFKGQFIVGLLFVLFSACFMLAQFLYAFIGCLDPRKLLRKDRFCKIMNMILVYIAVTSILLCWVIWLAVGHSLYLVIGDNCKEFPTDGSIPNLCASYGAYFGFACLAYISIIYFWGWSFRFRKYFERINEIPRLKADAQNTAHQQYPISEYAKPVEFEVKEGSYENNNEEISVSERSSGPEIIKT